MPGYLTQINDWPDEFTPTGGIQSTTITGALSELDSEKGSVSGETWNGNHLFSSSSVVFLTSTVDFSSASVSGLQGLGGGAMGGGTDKVFFENDTVVSSNYSITSGKNAVSAGPISISASTTVTVPSGSTWVIV